MYQLHNIVPSDSLRPFVKSIWFLDQTKASKIPLKLIPDGFPEILFTIRGKCVTTYSNGYKESTHPISFLGQISGTIEFQADSDFQGIFVKLYPWAASSFLPIDQRSTLDQTTDISREHQWRTLSLELLQDENVSITEKMNLIEAEMQFWVQKINSPPPVLKRLTKDMLSSRGMRSVGDLTNKLRCSRRYLERIFNRHLGLPPDYYNQLIKTKEISRRISKGDYFNFSQLSDDYSFVDSAHFSRSFKKRTGMTPSHFKKYMEQFPIEQKDAYLKQFIHAELARSTW